MTVPLGKSIIVPMLEGAEIEVQVPPDTAGARGDWPPPDCPMAAATSGVSAAATTAETAVLLPGSSGVGGGTALSSLPRIENFDLRPAMPGSFLKLAGAERRRDSTTVHLPVPWVETVWGGLWRSAAGRSPGRV